MQPSVAQILALAIRDHGERQEAATVTLAIAVEKLALSQLQVAKANQQQADSIAEATNIFRRRF